MYLRYQLFPINFSLVTVTLTTKRCATLEESEANTETWKSSDVSAAGVNNASGKESDSGFGDGNGRRRECREDDGLNRDEQ